MELIGPVFVFIYVLIGFAAGYFYQRKKVQWAKMDLREAEKDVKRLERAMPNSSWPLVTISLESYEAMTRKE